MTDTERFTRRWGDMNNKQNNYLGYGIFLVLLVPITLSIWATPFICVILGDGHLDLLIRNIINLLNPTWPIVTLVISGSFIISFKKEISHLIDRIRKFQGLELDPQQYTPPTSEISRTLNTGLNNSSDGTTNETGTFTPPLTNPTIVSVENRIREDLNNKYAALDDASKLQALIYHYAVEKLNFFCETIYSSIFGSQIKLLKLLQQQSGIPKSQVDEYFSNTKQLHSSHYEGWDVNTYLNFLIRNQLIELNPIEQKFYITAHGEHFLIWLGVFSRPENKDL